MRAREIKTMSNTIRDLSELLTLFADNNSNQITAQDIRDFIVTTNSWRFSRDYNDLENLPSLGSLSSQDANNVNITGGNLSNINNLSVTGSISTGLSLPADCFSTTKLTVRSPIIDFKVTGDVEIFSVPTGYMFLIDSMEVLTTSIFGSNNSLSIRFGTESNPEEYYSPSLISSSNIGDRHIVDIAQNASLSGNSITFGVEVASSADVHRGVGIIHGSLIKTI